MEDEDQNDSVEPRFPWLHGTYLHQKKSPQDNQYYPRVEWYWQTDGCCLEEEVRSAMLMPAFEGTTKYLSLQVGGTQFHDHSGVRFERVQHCWQEILRHMMRRETFSEQDCNPGNLVLLVSGVKKNSFRSSAMVTAFSVGSQGCGGHDAFIS